MGNPVQADLPATIGRYRVLRELGRGGMGIVYAASDDRLGRDVAVKLLHDHARGDLLSEARAAARVSHPRSCQIFEVDTHEGRPFLVMELLEGETLAARLLRGPLPVDAAIDTMLSVLDGLGALHRLGLVHRDLKPANIFLTSYGVKLVDFGLARPLPAGDAATMSMTLPGQILGTPHYMAPEQARGEPLDARTDIFSAGTVLFEALTGRPPFGGATAIEILHAVLTDHPPTIGGSPALVALDRILQRAMSKDPVARYATAEDMARALVRARELPAGAGEPLLRSEVRVGVLPFRLLRPDAEIEFLSLGLADAISHTLAQEDCCLVRSPFAAARAVERAGNDFRRLASELDVDLVLTGTLLRGGDRVRVTAQFVDCSTGRVTWSHALDGSVGDVFGLQDELVTVALGALPLPTCGPLSSGSRPSAGRHARGQARPVAGAEPGPRPGVGARAEPMGAGGGVDTDSARAVGGRDTRSVGAAGGADTDSVGAAGNARPDPALAGPSPDAALRSAVGYRLFLRANQLAHSPPTWQVARDLYLESLRENPGYAPAWAQLGRMHRVVTKYYTYDQMAQQAGYAAARASLTRALELDPDLAIAHYHFAQVETDQGQSIEALRRLLTLAGRRPSDPELFAGLVLVCRYCGLLDASLAADEIARRLDPTLPTSVVLTHWALGDYERVLATQVSDNDRDLHTFSLWALGRLEEARAAACADERRHAGRPVMYELRRIARLILEGKADEAREQLADMSRFDATGRSRVVFPDGEGTYLAALLAALAGARGYALDGLRLAVSQGYACVPLFQRDPWLDPLRDHPDFAAVMADAGARRAEAIRVFVEQQGPALLGVTATGSW